MLLKGWWSSFESYFQWLSKFKLELELVVTGLDLQTHPQWTVKLLGIPNVMKMGKRIYLLALKLTRMLNSPQFVKLPISNSTPQPHDYKFKL